jgi:nitrogenase molybdenum-iron protein NifN
MPMGGALAIKGLENSITLMHSSQGCSTYIRRHIAQHFNEPMDIASSSLTEEATVYGGGNKLKKAITNVIKVYNPKTIGITTSCLAETIGEDIERIVSEYIVENNLKDKINIFYSGTPGYGGTENEGYYYTVRKIVENYVKPSKKHNKINIITGYFLSPAEIREIKNMLKIFGVEAIILPDYSETLDAPYYGKKYKRIPSGGTKIIDIEKMSGSLATIELGVLLDDKKSPGKYIEDIFGVKLYRLPLPIGLKNSDKFIKLLSKIFNKQIPKEIVNERRRYIDGMIDSHKYNGEGRATIYGSPEMVYSLAKLCDENGIKPVIIATGSENKLLQEKLEKELKYKNIKFLIDTDFETIGKISKEKNVNIALGNSDGKYLTENYKIPLIRTGFHVHDRVGGQRENRLFYKESMNFLDKITNCLLENKYSVYREKMYKNYFLEEELL